MAPLALGGNEPDQVGFCQVFADGKPHPLSDCDGFQMRADGCKEHPCAFVGNNADVTGCGMWTLSNAGCSAGVNSPLPFQCFGATAKPCSAQPTGDCCPADCKVSTAETFKQFYVDLAKQGYTYASAPLVASDPQFSDDLMSAAGCDRDDVKSTTGQARLLKGCPTHSAFHFYSLGCPDPTNPNIEDFKRKVSLSKNLNDKFSLDGTIVNELGSLTAPAQPTCPPENIANMMGELFHHIEDEGKGVVSQMVWFNQDSVGGTYDLRLVNEQGVTPLGTKYMEVCQDWARQNGVSPNR